MLNRGGVIGKLLGGWQATTIVRPASGQPLSFRSGYCNLPGQFAAGYIPGVLHGANIWAQDKSSFDVSKPIFNNAAFEPPSNFNPSLARRFSPPVHLIAHTQAVFLQTPSRIPHIVNRDRTS